MGQLLSSRSEIEETKLSKYFLHFSHSVIRNRNRMSQGWGSFKCIELSINLFYELLVNSKLKQLHNWRTFRDCCKVSENLKSCRVDKNELSRVTLIQENRASERTCWVAAKRAALTNLRNRKLLTRKWRQLVPTELTNFELMYLMKTRRNYETQSCAYISQVIKQLIPSPSLKESRNVFDDSKYARGTLMILNLK